MVEKVTVVTTLLGDHDSLRVPASQVGVEVNWVCITDQSVELPAPWQAIRVSRPVNRRAVARFWKTTGLRRMTTEWCIWIDANVEVISPFFCLEAVAVAWPTGIATWEHPWRSCIYEEALACLEGRKEKPEYILAQVARYKRAGYEPHQGLYSTQCVVWDLSRQAMRDLAEAWWEECRGGSLRDQISLPYVARCAGIRVAIFPIGLDQGFGRLRRVVRRWQSRSAGGKLFDARSIVRRRSWEGRIASRRSSGLKYLNKWVAIHPHR